MSKIYQLREAHARRVSKIVSKVTSLEDNALDTQQAFLGQMRKELLGTLADAGSYKTFHLQQVLAAIDDEIEKYSDKAESAIDSAAEDIFGYGRELVDSEVMDAGLDVDLFSAIGPTGSPFGLSADLLERARTLASSQVGGIWTELGTDLETSIRRMTIGIDTSGDAMKAVADIVSAKRGPFVNAEYNAERIVRTEGNRIFSSAGHDRMLASNKVIGGLLRKYWLPEDDSRTRETHASAGSDYGIDDAIEIEEPYEVGDDELQYPCDPNGSAEETINCRCRSVPKVLDSEEEE